MVEQHNCPICQLAAHIEGTGDFGRFKKYSCPRCGLFTITHFAERRLEGRQISSKLSAWIRNRNEKTADVPEINSDNIEQIVSALPDYSPSEKLLILLRNIERKTKFPGYEVQINPKFDAPLAWTSEPEEFIYYLQSLIERGLLKRISMEHYVISPDGWDYLEKRTLTMEDKSQVFVAMSFSEEMKPIWKNAFKEAITEAGYKAYRIDVEPHIDRIDAKIITEIKNSRFLVADVSQQKTEFILKQVML